MRLFAVPYLCRYLGLDYYRHQQGIRHALTPFQHNETNNNSRFIYWFQYVFRGEVASWIYQNIGGTGKQLQQFLGDVMAHRHLEKLYHSLCIASKLSSSIREKVQNTERHLYVAGLLGYLLQQTSDNRVNAFIFKFFIEPNDHLLPDMHRKKDAWHVLKILCGLLKMPIPVLHYTCAEGIGQHTFQCSIGARVFAHTSVSYRYAKKKCIRLAATHIVDSLSGEERNTESYQKMIAFLQVELKLRKEQNRLNKVSVWEHKQESNKAERALKKAEKEQRAKLEDAKRKQAKQKTKEKITKKKQTVYRDYTEEEIKNMTTAKRRRLEDLGILEKR